MHMPLVAVPAKGVCEMFAALPLAAKLGIGGAALAAGALIAKDVLHHATGKDTLSQGGSYHGSKTGIFVTYQHTIAWGLKNFLFHPNAVLTVSKAEKFARDREHELFHGGRDKNGYDNGPDAFRHTYASAVIVYRLIHERHMNPEKAIKMAYDSGLAHERDSALTGVHQGFSGAMDVHNNAVGIQIGLEQALHGLAPESGADMAIENAVLAAIRTGKTTVMDATTSAPRASRASDISGTVFYDAPVGYEPSGRHSFTVGVAPTS